MKLKSFLLSIHLLFSFALHAETENKAMPQKTVEALEKSLTAEVKKRNPTKKELQVIYNLAGRELFYLGYLKKAEEYYQKSIAVDVEANKTEAYVNLMSIAFTEKNMEKLKDQREKAESYYKKHKKFRNTEVEMYLSSIDDVLNKKISPDKVSFFSEYVRKDSFENILKDKKYEEELMKYNVDKLLETDLSSIVDYDLLNVLHRQKNVKKLFCYEQYHKYSDSFAPSVIICGMLHDYLNGKKIKEESFTRLEKYFQEINGERKYLLPYLRELK